MSTKALYKVCLGIRDARSGHVDNWRTQNVLAPTALTAIRKVKLMRNEYVAEVHLIGREAS